MKVGVGSAALVTGGGAGIGQAVCVALAKCGATITVVDFSEAGGLETVKLVEEEHAKLAEKPQGPAAIFVKCDVSIPEKLFAAFALHESTYGKLDVLLNNAGIGDLNYFTLDDSSDGSGKWRNVLSVDLAAVIDGTRLGIQMMKRTKRPGSIINVASAAGLYPAPAGPIYSAAKAGVVMFTRALEHLKQDGIRVNVICPAFVETNLTKLVPAHLITDGYIPMDTIIRDIFGLIEDEDRAGDCLWVTNRRGTEIWPTPEEKAKYLQP